MVNHMMLVEHPSFNCLYRHPLEQLLCLCAFKPEVQEQESVALIGFQLKEETHHHQFHFLKQ